jgi:branched-chain amino acid transport system ATP-binding protein
MIAAPDALLRVDNLFTGYGKKQVVGGVSLDVRAGEIVALIGHNGAGKSTILKAILKQMPVWEGRLVFDGQDLSRVRPSDLARLGITHVPQGSRIFQSLTVRENLHIAGTTSDARAQSRQIEGVLALFPSLQTKLGRRASTLSGGEMQMLALANALVPSPRMLVLDEPSLGLAPPLVRTALNFVQSICADRGVAALVVEQKVREVLRIAHRACVLRLGRVTYFGPAAPLQDESKLRQVYL